MRPDYWLDRWPVTIARFCAFVDASGYDKYHDLALQGPDRRPSKGLDEGVCALYREIAAGKLHVDLSSEPEWGKAAHGSDTRRYPRVDKPDTEMANFYMDVGETSVVGCYPCGESPSGCKDMSGNVWEWTRSLPGDYPYPESGQLQTEREERSA